MIRRGIVSIVSILFVCGCQGDPGSLPGTRGASTPSADGVTVRYRVAGSGSPAIVFVHCWSCDSSYWADQIQHFSPDHKTVAIDLAGHGDSGTARTEWTVPAFAADVVTVVEKLDLSEVVLVGHSMGGSVVVAAAGLIPERVIGLVGVDNFHSIEVDFTDEQLAGFLGPFRADYAGATAGFARGMFPADADSLLIDAIATDMAAAPPEIAVPAFENLLLWLRADCRPALERLQAPLYCINSNMRPTDTDEIRRYAPTFEVTTMDGVGHFPYREKPEEFNRILAEIVRGFADAR